MHARTGSGCRLRLPRRRLARAWLWSGSTISSKSSSLLGFTKFRTPPNSVLYYATLPPPPFTYSYFSFFAISFSSLLYFSFFFCALSFPFFSLISFFFTRKRRHRLKLTKSLLFFHLTCLSIFLLRMDHFMVQVVRSINFC